MAHTHTWRVTGYVLLAIPDADQFADRFTSWQCTTCEKRDVISGCVKLGEPLNDPDFWYALQAAHGEPIQVRRLRR